MVKIGLAVLSVIFLLASPAWPAEQEKIAVAAEGKTAKARVSGVAARAPYYLLFDGSGNLLEAAANPFKDARGGAGTSVVTFLSQKGATLVVAGNFGGNMIQGMKGKGMRYLEFKGSAAEAVKKAVEGKK
jgi:predicted Fe-Mo cluster-binding NifX family protein